MAIVNGMPSSKTIAKGTLTVAASGGSFVLQQYVGSMPLTGRAFVFFADSASGVVMQGQPSTAGAATVEFATNPTYGLEILFNNNTTTTYTFDYTIREVL